MMGKRDVVSGQFASSEGRWPGLLALWRSWPLDKTLREFCERHGVRYHSASKRLKASDRRRQPEADLPKLLERLIAMCAATLERGRVTANQASQLLPRLLNVQEALAKPVLEQVIAAERRGRAFVTRLTADALHGATLCAHCAESFRTTFTALLGAAEKRAETAQESPGGARGYQTPTEAEIVDPGASGGLGGGE